MTSTTFSVAFLLSLASVTVWSAAIGQDRCQWSDQWYTVGAGQSFHPDPCTSCRCTGEPQAMCIMAACVQPPCVDAVLVPDQCCSVCPNGPNCRAPDGSVIPAGQEVSIGTRRCQCVHSDFMSRADAVCRMN